MRPSSRFVPIASCAALAAALAGCTYSRTDLPPVAVTTVPAPPTVVAVPAAPVVVAPATVEFGRVSAIEYFPGGTASTRINVPGAIVGGVAGAVVGRDAATVLGGPPGAPPVGTRTGTTTTVIDPAYRVTIQTDPGGVRTYDVPALGDLRVGDRVRVDNGVIYRS
jgi:outer membrane lipoprotein SlyB